MKTYLLAALVAFGSITAVAQDQFGRNAPLQQLVRVTEDGKVEMLVLACVCKPFMKTESYTVKVPVEANGKREFKTEEKVRTVCEMVTESHVYASPLELSRLQAFETDGRAVDVKTLAKRLKGQTLVVVSNDGKMIAPYYAAVFKPGTLILAPQAGAGAAPPPPAAVNNSATSPLRLVSQEAANPEPSPALPAAAPVATPQLDIQTPKSPPPTLLFARVPEAGKINLRHYSESIGEREVATEIVQNGVPNTVLLKQTQKSTRSESTQLDLIDVKATTADARPLTAQVLSEKLKTATVVLASAMGQNVDPVWLQNVKPGVVVLILPQGVGFGGAACYPVPAPIPAGQVIEPNVPQPGPAPAPVPAPAPKAKSDSNT